MLLGVGALAVASYLIYQNNKPKGFLNFGGVGDKCLYYEDAIGNYNGKTVYVCCPGEKFKYAYNNGPNKCSDKPRTPPRITATTFN